MNAQKPTIVLVHGAFAESASWNGVISRLQARGVTAVAAANPLRGLAGDAAYVRDVIASINGPVILVGHSYGGLVITEAAAQNPAVVGLVYVCAFVPETGDSAFALSASEPGSTLGETLAAYPLAAGGNEFVIRREAFHHQFAADVPAGDVLAAVRDSGGGLVAGVSIWLTADVDRVEISAGGFEVCAVAADFDACKETARSVLVKWEVEVLCGWPPALCVVL